MHNNMEVRFLVRKEGLFWKLYSERISGSSGGLFCETADVGLSFFNADEAEAYAINNHGAKLNHIRRERQ